MRLTSLWVNTAKDGKSQPRINHARNLFWPLFGEQRWKAGLKATDILQKQNFPLHLCCKTWTSSNLVFKHSWGGTGRCEPGWLGAQQPGAGPRCSLLFALTGSDHLFLLSLLGKEESRLLLQIYYCYELREGCGEQKRKPEIQTYSCLENKGSTSS